MKAFRVLLLTAQLSLNLISGFSQSFTPTIKNVNSDLGKSPNYKMMLSPTRAVSFTLIDAEMNPSMEEEINRRLKFIKWNAKTSGVPEGSIGIATGVTTAQIERIIKVQAEAGSEIWLSFYDIKNKTVASLPLPYKAPIDRAMENIAAQTENQFCGSRNTTYPPDYNKLIQYLQSHTSPCPTQNRYEWVSNQFIRIQNRIEELKYTKPQETVALYREYSQLSQPYYVTGEQTGWKSDNDFRRCINFFYNVDMAIEKIRKGN